MRRRPNGLKIKEKSTPDLSFSVMKAGAETRSLGKGGRERY